MVSKYPFFNKKTKKQKAGVFGEMADSSARAYQVQYKPKISCCTRKYRSAQGIVRAWQRHRS